MESKDSLTTRDDHRNNHLHAQSINVYSNDYEHASSAKSLVSGGVGAAHQQKMEDKMRMTF